MFQMETKNEMAAAVFHDAVEDTEVTIDQLKQGGFDDEVIEAVDSVTNRVGKTYEDFIITNLNDWHFTHDRQPPGVGPEKGC